MIVQNNETTEEIPVYSDMADARAHAVPVGSKFIADGRSTGDGFGPGGIYVVMPE